MFTADASSSIIACSEAVTAEIAGTPPRSLRSALPPVRLTEADGQSRADVETYIARRFAEVYDAQVHSFMPRLIGMHEADRSLIAAFGLRAASSGPLFLEQYLDAPVELMVQRAFGERVERRQIAEIGNLAGSTPGALRRLIPAVTELLQAEGFRWVAFTGAARLCNAFTRLHLPLTVVAPARLERLPVSQRHSWGRYYDKDPSVMLGDVAVGYRSLLSSVASGQGLKARLAPLAHVGAP